MADRKLEGTVIDTKGTAVAVADVWLSLPGGNNASQGTDAAGAFSFALGDADTRGTATLRVRPKNSPLTEKRQVKLPAEGSPPPQLVKVHADEISATAGWAFLGLMILFLTLLSVLYLDLHGVTFDKLRQREQSMAVTKSKLSNPLADMLNVTKNQVAAARTALAATAAGRPPEDAEPDNVAPEQQPASQTEAETAEGTNETREAVNPARQALHDAMVDDSLESAKQIFAGLEKSLVGLLDADKAGAMNGLFAQAERALDEGAVDALDATLDRLLEQAEVERVLFLWEDAPGRLLEVMFWALVATLLRLIFDSGYYLYKSSFLRSAIPRHLAMIVVIPVVAVIIAFVLTLVSVEMKIGDTAIQLDMSNVLISIVVGALIGLAPWKSWNLLHKLADLLFTNLARVFKLGDQPAAAE